MSDDEGNDEEPESELPYIDPELLRKIREERPRLKERHGRKPDTGSRDDERNQHHRIPGERGLGATDGMQATASADRAAGLHRRGRGDGGMTLG